MLDISTFLIRWLFLCNLIRDAAEIQMLPYTPYAPPSQPDDHSSYYQQPDHRINPQEAMTARQGMETSEDLWKDQCVRGILSYPPGSQRLLVIDAMRVDLVQQLSRTMRTLDETHQNLKQKLRQLARIENGATDATDSRGTSNDILSFQRTNEMNEHSTRTTLRAQLKETKHKVREARSFMPQMTSAVLKSPPAFDPNLVNPVQKLRNMILTRCQQDPCWGIELCWVLEAEVGHAWKNLFEHRQQTGKRLIVVLPAEKAAVLAKIGTEKREAFDLLQDAEQLTAFGYLPDLVVDGGDNYRLTPASETSDQSSGFQAKRLPSSLSLRRCSHFGDTMHFIDRLTRISMDLIRVPIPQRKAVLLESLHEVNRRLRRRMATAGEVSLDVNDKLGPYDWPNIRDVNQNMIQHSIHFPLESYSGVWSQGCGASFKDSRDGVMAVLNVVVDESRILSSRERCPYLVHLEVVRTGVDGSDPILYSCGAETLGVTVREALGMSSETVGSSTLQPKSNCQKYEIPPELRDHCESTAVTESRTNQKLENSLQHRLPRGGWQVEAYSPDASQGDAQHQYSQHNYQEMQVAQPQPYAVSNQGPMVSFGSELLEKVFGRPFSEKSEEIRRNSPYGNLDGWRLASFIVKAGEDIRREAMVAQIISKLDKWFKAEIQESDRPHMRPYTIMCVGGDAGLVECLSDTNSIDEVKKSCDGFTSLRDYFERAYGVGGLQPSQDPSSRTRQITFEQAQDNFLRSLVGYSLVCYVLQVKDRHNANILLDREGNIIHIDFGYVLGDTPKMGKVPIFSERAPFKLSTEFWDVLGGWNVHSGGLGVRFCKMFERAFECASSHGDEIASVVEATMLSLTRNPKAATLAAAGVRSRLRMRGTPDSVEQKMFIMDLVNAALTSWGTSTYDWLQKSMNGYQ